MALVKTISSLFYRMVNVAADWGLGAAIHFVVLSRLGRRRARVKLRPLNASFTYRRVIDRPVLSQFDRDFGFIDVGSHPAIQTVVDAGANIGVFTVQARRLYPEAQIVALEVEAENFSILQENVANLWKAKATKAALWKDSAGVELVLGTSADSHSVRPRGAGTLVPSITVKQLMAEESWAKLDLLKMDIEGAEQFVIQSLDDQTLSNINVIRFEANDSDAPGNTLAVMNRLVGQDFDAFAFDENLFLIRRSTGWKFQRYYVNSGVFPR